MQFDKQYKYLVKFRTLRPRMSTTSSTDSVFIFARAKKSKSKGEPPGALRYSLNAFLYIDSSKMEAFAKK